jgi:YHS domain-containing protein
MPWLPRSSSMRRHAVCACVILCSTVSSTAAFAQSSATTVAPSAAPVFQIGGVALRGYDPVSYFADAPQEGTTQFETSYRGATWRFVSAANRERFVANPEAFVPQYGGFCALGMAHGGAVPSDPNAYSVYNGKLYLNSTRLVRTTWSYAKDWMISRADPNWQRAVSNSARAATQAAAPSSTDAPPAARPAVAPANRPDPTLAIAGLDVTSYFEPAGPQLGDSAITLSWRGKTWRFRNESARARFTASPESFAPQFDGLSAITVAHGEKWPGNPRIFSVVDGKLYLELGTGPQETWRRNAQTLIERANAQWKLIANTP